MNLSSSFEKSMSDLGGDLAGERIRTWPYRKDEQGVRRARIVLITTDRYITSVFKSVMGAELLAIVPCIDTVWERYRSMHINPMLDASTAPPCCIDFINRWRTRASVPSTVVRRSAETDDGIPGAPRSGSAVDSRPAASCGTARHAWANRTEILSSRDNPPQASLLIELARTHDRQSYTVEEAARTMGISGRRLHQISRATLGYSPKIILDLARTASVALSLNRGEEKLLTIARAHSFRDQPAMNRQFVRFVGIPPGIYRSQISLRS